jgi:hypothetical protein
MTRTGWLSTVGLSVGAVAVSIAAFLYWSDRSMSSSDTGSAGSSSANAPPLTGPRAVAMSDQLAAGTDAGLRSAIAVPSGQPLDPAAARHLAAIGPITLDPATFRYLDARNAAVAGPVAHPPTGMSPTWTFTLTYVASQWKLVDGKPDP